MKKYTFTVPKTTNNNYNSFAYSYSKPSSVDNLKSFLADKAVEKYPWLASTYEPSYNVKVYNTLTPKTTKYTLKFKTKKDYNTFFSDFNYGTLYDLLYSYNTNHNSFDDEVDEYDFKINGTPIRILDDRIQIGYNFISKDTFNLNEGLKKNIYNIYLNIYNS